MNHKSCVLLVTAIFLAAIASLHAQTTFSKVTTGDIVNDSGDFIWFAWGDFNNDGFLDLVVANWNEQTNVFYWNNGGGTFTKMALGDPVQDADYHIGAAAGDYDNDGNLDLLVSAGADSPPAAAHRNKLYRNNGNGVFSQVSGGSATNQLGYFGPCTWGDYDNDGFLDLFIANHGDANDDGGRNVLFHNNGDGTFANVTAGAVVNDVSVGFDAMWADYDNDGFADLLVVNNTGNALNFLYHNDRSGTFTRVLTNVVGTDRWSSGAEGAAWGDYDNDGFQDLFVTGNDGTTDTLYRNNGDGTFMAITSSPMSSRPVNTSSLGCAWGDYDNDGYLDLVVTSADGYNRLFHNNGDGSFTEILTGDPTSDGGPDIESLGCTWVDYDNDGFLDLFVTSFDHSVPTSNSLYHNNGNTNAWLEVKLVGTASNRSAIGAKVRAYATIGGKPLAQMREMNSGGGRWAKPLVAHFGLGDATNVATLRIEWPSGIVQILTNVAPKQILTVVEHQTGAINAPSIAGVSRSTDGTVNLSASGDTGLLYLLEGSTNLVNWAWLGVRSNATGTVQFTDSRATNYPGRFYRVSNP